LLRHWKKWRHTQRESGFKRDFDKSRGLNRKETARKDGPQIWAKREIADRDLPWTRTKGTSIAQKT